MLYTQLPTLRSINHVCSNGDYWLLTVDRRALIVAHVMARRAAHVTSICAVLHSCFHMKQPPSLNSGPRQSDLVLDGHPAADGGPGQLPVLCPGSHHGGHHRHPWLVAPCWLHRQPGAHGLLYVCLVSVGCIPFFIVLFSVLFPINFPYSSSCLITYVRWVCALQSSSPPALKPLALSL